MYGKRCIVTGAAGFIGSALARLLLKETDATVLVVDKLTYAGVPESLKEVGLDPETLKCGQVLKSIDDPKVMELYNKAWDRIKATDTK